MACIANMVYATTQTTELPITYMPRLLTFVDLNCQKCHRPNLNTVGVPHGGVDNRKGVDNCTNCIKAWKKKSFSSSTPFGALSLKFVTRHALIPPISRQLHLKPVTLSRDSFFLCQPVTYHDVTSLLLLISMLWHRQAISESKRDKLSWSVFFLC